MVMLSCFYRLVDVRHFPAGLAEAGRLGLLGVFGTSMLMLVPARLGAREGGCIKPVRTALVSVSELSRVSVGGPVRSGWCCSTIMR